MTGFDLSTPRRVHVVAVGGAAMSGIARYLVQLGHQVSGSDIRATETTDKLSALGVAVSIGHSAENVPIDADAIVYSTAVALDNVELIRAAELGIERLHRSQMMQPICSTKANAAVVSGTHGKTSTSSMLAEILSHAGWNPSFFIGGTATSLATNACFNPAGDWIVVEGDESDRSFLAFDRNAVLVTNLEADHLEHWDHSFARLRLGFVEFVQQCQGSVVLCADDPESLGLQTARPDATTYGFGAAAQFRIASYEPTTLGTRIVCLDPQGEAVAVELAVRGRDMATNALGAATLACALGLSWRESVNGLEGFRGVARRFEFRGSYNGVDCYDDYAHTATEIATTIARAREGGWRRVIAVCQPHRYTRIAAHGGDYGAALKAADIVVVTALDPAFELPIAGVDATIVVESVRSATPAVALEYLPDWHQLTDLPWRVGQPGDVIVTLGCGTITDAHALWANESRRRG